MRKICFLIIVIILVSGCVRGSETAYITKVIDGDTFVISSGEHIRLLGINAPEKDEYYYEEASEKLKELVENKYVTLEGDKTNKDWYGRELRYVYVGSEFVNAKLVEGGYARLYLLKDRKYENILKYAEDYAKEKGLGIWNTAE